VPSKDIDLTRKGRISKLAVACVHRGAVWQVKRAVTPSPHPVIATSTLYPVQHSYTGWAKTELLSKVRNSFTWWRTKTSCTVYYLTLPIVKLVFCMSPHLNVLCTNSVKPCHTKITIHCLHHTAACLCFHTPKFISPSNSDLPIMAEMYTGPFYVPTRQISDPTRSDPPITSKILTWDDQLTMTPKAEYLNYMLLNLY